MRCQSTGSLSVVNEYTMTALEDMIKISLAGLIHCKAKLERPNVVNNRVEHVTASTLKSSLYNTKREEKDRKEANQNEKKRINMNRKEA